MLTSEHDLNALGSDHLERYARIGIIAGRIAHDLTNHLQIVLSALDPAEKSTRTSPAFALLGNARFHVERAACLSRQLLNAPKEGPVSEINDLVASLAALRSSIEALASPGIDVSFQIEADFAPVVCDRRELEVAVLNLVTNAKHAMPDGGNLMIAVKLQGADNHPTARFAVLRVTASGRGIPTEILNPAFDPSVSARSAELGNRLGLSLVARFARSAGGALDIQSAVGRGTSIYLRLPACASVAGARAG